MQFMHTDGRTNLQSHRNKLPTVLSFVFSSSFPLNPLSSLLPFCYFVTLFSPPPPNFILPAIMTIPKLVPWVAKHLSSINELGGFVGLGWVGCLAYR